VVLFKKLLDFGVGVIGEEDGGGFHNGGGNGVSMVRGSIAARIM
jgi:hypothetical protein